VKDSAAKKQRAKLLEVINLSSSSCIAGQHISAMSNSEREDVVPKLTKPAEQVENKHVKACVLAISYDKLCQTAFVEHLQGHEKPVTSMVHAKLKTVLEEQGIFAQIKIGDCVVVEPDYYSPPGLCSDGGIGCVFGLQNDITNHDTSPLSGAAPTCTAVNVHYLTNVES
jgi:hypothetical protein